MNEPNSPSTGQNGQSSPTPQNLNESSQATVKSRRPFITAENAKRLQSLGAAARMRKSAERAAMVAKANADMELVRPLMVRAVELTTEFAAQPELEYRLERLKRTREQLAKLDTLLDEAEDWKAAKAICEAIARLSVIEGNLAGRPLPGSRRPGREKPTRGPATGGSLMADE